MNLLLVALGAAVGAPLRFLVVHALHRRDPALPWGTLAVNVAGSFLFGVVGVAASPTGPLLAVAGIGFCGALTTYSAFGYETVRLSASRGARTALGYVALQLGCGLTAAELGLLLVGAAGG